MIAKSGFLISIGSKQLRSPILVRTIRLIPRRLINWLKIGN